MNKYQYSTPLSFTSWIIHLTTAGVSRITDSAYDKSIPSLPVSPLKNWLDAFFEGNPIDIDFDIYIPNFPPFYSKVWHKLTGIPYGTMVTYKELASLLNNPNAVRAVGSACAQNPLSLVLPCHRVVGTSCIGGFSALGGITLKQSLIDMEKKHLHNTTKEPIVKLQTLQ